MTSLLEQEIASQTGVVKRRLEYAKPRNRTLAPGSRAIGYFRVRTGAFTG